MEALRAGDDEAVAAALALLGPAEVHEVHTPPDSLDGEDDGFVEIDFSDRCWRDDGEWWCDFPPPDGFTGREDGDYGDPDEPYQRQCTAEEAAILDADEARQRDAGRAEDAELRDTWFALLREEAERGRDDVAEEGDDKRRI